MDFVDAIVFADFHQTCLSPQLRREGRRSDFLAINHRLPSKKRTDIVALLDIPATLGLIPFCAAVLEFVSVVARVGGEFGCAADTSSDGIIIHGDDSDTDSSGHSLLMRDVLAWTNNLLVVDDVAVATARDALL